MNENLAADIAALSFGTLIERAEDCRELERIAGAEICGKYNSSLPVNTLRIKTDTEHYIVLLQDGNLKRLDLTLPPIMFERMEPTK